MRKIAFIILYSYLVIYLSPLGFAKIQDQTIASKACFQAITLPSSTVTKLETGKTDETVISDLKQYDEAVDFAPANCGQPNAFNNAYEKGDCSDSKVIISEINEPVGAATITLPTTITSDSSGGVADLYKGICCSENGPYTASGSTSSTNVCEQTRSIYYADYTTCEKYAAYCKKVQWLVASTGAGVIKAYVKQIYVFGAGIVGFVAVITIVFSGIQISISGASGDITAAKERIIQSIMGIALLFFSGLILYTINPTFFS